MKQLKKKKKSNFPTIICESNWIDVEYLMIFKNKCIKKNILSCEGSWTVDSYFQRKKKWMEKVGMKKICEKYLCSKLHELEYVR